METMCAATHLGMVLQTFLEDRGLYERFMGCCMRPIEYREGVPFAHTWLMYLAALMVSNRCRCARFLTNQTTSDPQFSLGTPIIGQIPTVHPCRYHTYIFKSIPTVSHPTTRLPHQTLLPRHPPTVHPILPHFNHNFIHHFPSMLQIQSQPFRRGFYKRLGVVGVGDG